MALNPQEQNIIDQLKYTGYSSILSPTNPGYYQNFSYGGKDFSVFVPKGQESGSSQLFLKAIQGAETPQGPSVALPPNAPPEIQNVIQKTGNVAQPAPSQNTPQPVPTSTPAPVPTSAPQNPAPIDYILRPGESAEQYNARIATARNQPVSAPQSSYTGPSIVDYLGSLGQASDFTSRSKLAQQFGIENYKGTAEQNTRLLDTLRSQRTETIQPIKSTSPPTPEVQSPVQTYLSDLGVSVNPVALRSSPSKTFSELYEDVYTRTGLNQLKTRINEVIGKLSESDKKYEEKVQEIQDNPWLTQSITDTEVEKERKKHEKERERLVDEMSLYEKLYTSGREDARFVTRETFDQYNSDRTYDQNQLKLLMDLVEKSAPKKTDDIKEYDFAVSQGFGGSFTDFLKEKKQITEGLNPSQLQSAIDRVSDDYRQDPIVKQYTTALPGWQFMASINPKTTNPSDDIGMIYAFAKIMDPESVVREGEYATVQKYAQSWAQNFGFNAARIFSNTKFLTSKALSNMQTTAKAKMDALTVAHDNARGTYNQRIGDLRSGKVAGELPTYGSPTSLNQENATKVLDSILNVDEKQSQSWFDNFLSVFGLKAK